MPDRTDRNEALRLADELAGDQLYGLQRRCRDEAAALLRQQAERIAELEATQAGIMQAITDPENQPSQYGTVTLDYLSDKLKAWEDKWFKRDQQANKAEAERDQLRAEVERLRAPLSEEQIWYLTNDGMRNAAGGIYESSVIAFARAVERAHVAAAEGAA